MQTQKSVWPQAHNPTAAVSCKPDTEKSGDLRTRVTTKQGTVAILVKTDNLTYGTSSLS